MTPFSTTLPGVTPHCRECAKALGVYEQLKAQERRWKVRYGIDGLCGAHVRELEARCGS